MKFCCVERACGVASEGDEVQPLNMALAIVRWVTSNAEYLSFAVFTMAQRVTLRKRNPYNTTSNRRRVVKTPGGKLVYHHIRKLPTAPKCGDCGIALPGVCVD